jgi:hypothetical protein
MNTVDNLVILALSIAIALSAVAILRSVLQ